MKNKALLVAAALMALSSACKKQNNQENQLTDSKNKDCNCTIEQASPDSKAEIITFGKGSKQFKIEKKDGQYILGGDMVLNEQQVAFLKRKYDQTGTVTESTFVDEFKKRWPGGVVYYSIDPALPANKQAWVTGAISHWETNTKLTFVARTTQANYVYFTPGSGCSSSVGMTGKRQNITLGNCSLGSTIHEIGHAIGLLHEQSRADRDDYIIINTDNIEDGKEHNFQTYVERGLTGGETGALDFGSIMMYPSSAFSSNGKPTITKLDGTTFTAQRNGLSAGDLTGIKYLYPDSVFQAN